MSLKNLVILLVVVVVQLGLSSINGTKATHTDERPTDEFLRARLGHFQRMNDARYLQIYEDYFKNVLQKRDKSLENASVNQWVNVRPTAHACLDYLQYFRVKKYSLQKPFDVILLDACLDWLYDDSHEKKFDIEQMGKTNTVKMNNLVEDKKFAEIFNATAFKTDTLPKKLLDDIYAYLIKLLEIHAENPSNGCHSLWMDAYNDFIEQVYIGSCETEIGCNFYGLEHSDEDSYLRLIASSTKEAAASCYNVMQKQMPALWKESRKTEEKSSSISRKLKPALGKLMGQQEQSILVLVGGNDPNKSIDLPTVAEDLRRIKNQDEKAIKRMTSALAAFAKQNADFSSSAGDAYGRVRYGRALTRLCRSYTDPSFFLAATGGAAVEEEDAVKKPFDFYHLIYSLVKVTNHETVYGISKQQFERDIMQHKWTPLYLATLACQIIATSVGSLNFDTNEGEFEVELDLAARVLYDDWPVDVIVSKLKPDPDAKRKSFSLFGRNKGDSGSDNESDSDDSDDEDEEEVSSSPKRSPLSSHNHGHQQQQQQQQHHVAPSPVIQAAPTHQETVKYSNPVFDSEGRLIQGPIPLPKLSEESIRMFITLKGRYPYDLPPGIDKVYTWMPALLNKVRKERLNNLMSTVKTVPSVTQPAAAPFAAQPTGAPFGTQQTPNPFMPSQPQADAPRPIRRVRNRKSPLMGRKRSRSDEEDEPESKRSAVSPAEPPSMPRMTTQVSNGPNMVGYNFGAANNNMMQQVNPIVNNPQPSFNFGGNNQANGNMPFGGATPNNNPMGGNSNGFNFGNNNNNNNQMMMNPSGPTFGAPANSNSFGSPAIKSFDFRGNNGKSGNGSGNKRSNTGYNFGSSNSNNNDNNSPMGSSSFSVNNNKPVGFDFRQGNSKPNPFAGNSNQNPFAGNSNQNPFSGNNNQNPFSGNNKPNPFGANNNQSPFGGNGNGFGGGMAPTGSGFSGAGFGNGNTQMNKPGIVGFNYKDNNNNGMMSFDYRNQASAPKPQMIGFNFGSS